MTTVLKNVYFDVLIYIVDKYNSTYLQTIKVKPKDVKPDFYAEYNIELMKNITNLKLVIM